MLAPPWGVGTPPRGNPGSATEMIEISSNVRSKFFRQISRQLTYLILSEGNHAWSQNYSMKLRSIGISFQRKN